MSTPAPSAPGTCGSGGAVPTTPDEDVVPVQRGRAEPDDGVLVVRDRVGDVGETEDVGPSESLLHHRLHVGSRPASRRRTAPDCAIASDGPRLPPAPVRPPALAAPPPRRARQCANSAEIMPP